ncbi:serine/threonine-protein kinase STY8-like isoform X2 [Durio zibethinus]|uniref:Serine/threonine-protein kinase STY8-like isoform X2 n=1 Tax=Durio zibethinus TaxID=66656 RepID=A0A6P5ZX64_DURZI|nr:serine/threonine-protein kinase STY8-like isoform X2 [Durio zibethinus]
MYIYIYILFNSFDPFKFQQLLAITMEDFRPSAPSSTDSVLERRLVQQNMDSGGPYRLLQCSSKGDKAGVIQELEKGVDPNVADYDRRTALHLAACEGWTEVVVLLLEKGADVNSLDRWCRTVSLIYILLFLAWRFLFLVILIDQKGFDAGNFCSHCLMRVALVIMRFARYLKLKGELIRESYKAHFQHYLTRPLVGVDSQAPCFEIDHYEVNMDEATLIGEGAYGEVYLVKWRGTEVAAKTIRSSIASNPKAKNIFLTELALWQRLRHPNIVQFFGVLKHSDRLIFLTEYLRNGSLYDILKKKGRLDPQTAISYALDIARGMNYLHQHKPHAIIHRDLTPRNVLQDEAGRLKVTDFGLSKLAQEKDSYGYKMTGGTGSYRYMAPEVYRRESYGKSIDVFSFALIVHEMFQGGPSHRGETAEQVADKRAYEDLRPPLSSYIYPEPIKTLLRECWHKNPDCRPTFEEIILKLEVIQQRFQRKNAMKACSCCVVL